MAFTRRFEFVKGDSDKFWHVAVAGPNVVITFGRNGTTGQTQKKEFSDEAAAVRHAEKVVGQKLAKGYVEVG